MRFTATAFFPVTLGLLGSFTQISVAAQGPIVSLKQGSFQGNATGEIVKFLGMPFAAAPCVIFLLFMRNLSDHVMPLEKHRGLTFCPCSTTTFISRRPTSDFVRSSLLPAVTRDSANSGCQRIEHPSAATCGL
jgi:hypothetical protein